MPKKERLAADRAELAERTADIEATRQAAIDDILSNGWRRLEAAYTEVRKAGHAMLLFGVRALQLHSLIPYGEFGKQLALQCPDISKSSAYRAMQSVSLLGETLFPSWEKSGPVADAYLAELACALTGEGRRELRGRIDDLIGGMTNQQLLLSLKRDKEADEPEKEPAAREWCLEFFATDPRGPEKEAALRFLAEAGEKTWGEVKRDCTAINTKRTDLTGPTPDRVKAMVESGILRIRTWSSPERWDVLTEEARAEMILGWSTTIMTLNPDLRLAAVRALKLKGDES